jgi:hypothetical protein
VNLKSRLVLVISGVCNYVSFIEEIKRKKTLPSNMLDIAGVQEFRWNNDGTELTDDCDLVVTEWEL